MDILQNFTQLLKSPRFVTWYFNTGFTLGAVFLNMIAESITEVGLNPTVAAIIGLLFAQISKALSNQAQGKPMGFMPKN